MPWRPGAAQYGNFDFPVTPPIMLRLMEATANQSAVASILISVEAATARWDGELQRPRLKNATFRKDSPGPPFRHSRRTSRMASVNELLSAAFAQHRAGNLPLAETLYRQLIAEAPNSADAWHLLGALYVQAKRPAEAVEPIERAIALDPDNPTFYSHLGAAYGELGNHEQSLKHLRKAVQLDPNAATAHYNLGTALRNAEQIEPAIESFRRSAALDPKASETHFNLANALRDLKRYGEAETSYRAAIALRPNYIKALINLALVLNEVRRRDEAVAMLRSAIACEPNHARAYLNLGSILRDGGRFDEAVVELERAVALDPQSAEAHNNLGTAYQARAEFDRAAACYRRALELNPELPDVHFSLGTQLLREGNLKQGFAEYDWRWKCRTFTPRVKDRPRWDGGPLEGRTILLHAEQGLGDTLHFVRYAELVQKRGGRTVVECQPPLVKLLASCRGIDQLVALGQPLPDFDVFCPLMSLPGVLGLEETELWTGPYLTAEPQRLTLWGERLGPHDKFRVGLCWQGNPQHLFDMQRSLPLASFAPLTNIPGVQLISLQKGSGSEQTASCGFAIDELGASLDADGAFLDTAAVIQHLDLVIAADTAIAHLAGALGGPVWILVSAHGDWRWMANREDSPWYPSARLFRQEHLGEWQAAMEQVSAALAQHVAGNGPLTDRA